MHNQSRLSRHHHLGTIHSTHALRIDLSILADNGIKAQWVIWQGDKIDPVIQRLVRERIEQRVFLPEQFFLVC